MTLKTGDRVKVRPGVPETYEQHSGPSPHIGRTGTVKVIDHEYNPSVFVQLDGDTFRTAWDPNELETI